MVPADSPRIPRVPGYSGAPSHPIPISPKGLSPAAAPLSSGFGYLPRYASSGVLQPRAAPCDAPGLGSCAFARRYLRNHSIIFFSSGYLDVSVPRVRLRISGCRHMAGGLPHSEIRASTGICPYARLIAACHVLRRLREPRHPSCALLSFPYNFRRNRYPGRIRRP